MNRVTNVAMTALESLVKVSESLGDIAEHQSTSRYDAAVALSKKASVDATIVSNLDKLASEVAASGQTGLGRAFGKSLLMGTGLTLPIVAGGVYLLNKYKEKADDTVSNTLDRLPDTIANVIYAGRQASAVHPRYRKYAELQGAYSLNLKLRDLGDSGIKTAADVDYRRDMLSRSNAHVAYLLADLLR